MAAKKLARSRIDPKLVSRLLRTVPQDKAFYFFTDIGQYSGKVAVSLADFCKTIDTVDVKSVDFHFKRQDFERWITGTIGDINLANMLNRIKKSIQGEELRVEICRIVERRLTELERQLV